MLDCQDGNKERQREGLEWQRAEGAGVPHQAYKERMRAFDTGMDVILKIFDDFLHNHTAAAPEMI